MFKQGEIVTWKSQAGGNTREKTGEIIFVLAPGQSANQAVSVFSKHKVQFDGGVRNHESYFVSVPGKTPNQKRSLYWPRVSALRKVYNHEL